MDAPTNERWTPAQVRQAREKLGLTQAQLAEKIGLRGPYAKDTVRGWESGKRGISGPAQMAIGYLLGGLHDQSN